MEINQLEHQTNGSQGGPSQAPSQAEIVTEGVGAQIERTTVVPTLEKNSKSASGSSTKNASRGQSATKKTTQYRKPTTEREYRIVVKHVITKEMNNVKEKVQQLRRAKEINAHELSKSISELRRLTTTLESMLTMSFAKIKELYQKIFPSVS